MAALFDHVIGGLVGGANLDELLLLLSHLALVFTKVSTETTLPVIHHKHFHLVVSFRWTAERDAHGVPVEPGSIGMRVGTFINYKTMFLSPNGEVIA